jgi:hypothetical protein
MLRREDKERQVGVMKYGTNMSSQCVRVVLNRASYFGPRCIEVQRGGVLCLHCETKNTLGMLGCKYNMTKK